MKTREPPPEKRAKGAGSAAAEPEAIRFRKLAKGVLNVSREKVLAEEAREKRRRKKRD